MEIKDVGQSIQKFYQLGEKLLRWKKIWDEQSGRNINQPAKKFIGWKKNQVVKLEKDDKGCQI